MTIIYIYNLIIITNIVVYICAVVKMQQLISVTVNKWFAFLLLMTALLLS